MNEPQVQQPAVAVGSIFRMSWGYDQTNVDYFQVLRVTSAGVYVREIQAQVVPGTQGFMSEMVKPAPGVWQDRGIWATKPEGVFKRLLPGNMLKFSSHRAYVCNPDSQSYSSWYA